MIKRTKETMVSVGRGDKPLTLRDVEQFCKDAREANFQGGDQPWFGSGLGYTLSLNRSEPA